MSNEAPTVISPVRGLQFREASAFFMCHDLCVGDPMIVEREPGNQADSNAIKVMAPVDEDSESLVHMGYIAAEKAKVMAAWMDKGWMYHAKVFSQAQKRGSKVVLNTLKVICQPIKPVSVKVQKKVHADV